MANIFDSRKDISLFKDERYLYQDFVPQRLPFREEELGEMVFCLKPAATGKKPTNIFLYGPPGTGKTVTSKFVLGELTEHSDRVKCLYINCFESPSKNAILAKATNFLGYAVPPRGLSSEELSQRFTAVIKSKRVVPVFVLDEAEQLLKGEDTKSLLYDFARMKEQYNITIGLIFISNDSFFLSLLDDRIRSSLQAASIHFEKYTSSQLKDILKERAEYAFFDNVLEEEVIPLCAAHSSSLGDARMAIDVLLKAGRLAEKENSYKVKTSHVRRSFGQEKIIKNEVAENLSEKEKLILDIVGEKEVSTTEVYSKLKDKFAQRTLRKALALLQEKKLVCIRSLTDKKGSTRLVSKK